MINEYRLDQTRALILASAVLDVFDTYRRRTQSEAGGVLLGRVYPSKVVVEVATVPSAADRAGRYFFNRSTRVSQRQVVKAWAASDGEQIYVGEWHSHPADVAVPSERDLTMIRNNLRDAKMEIDFLFLIVVGRVRDWIGVATPGGLRELQPRV